VIPLTRRLYGLQGGRKAFAVLSSAVLCMMLAVSPASAESDKGIVTFTVDNAYLDLIRLAVPEFKQRGIPGTLFAQTKAIGQGEDRITWDDALDLTQHGWEVGGHGHAHVRLTEVPDAVLDAELGVSAARIFRAIGVYPTSFASPYGDFDERVLDWARVYYDAHFRAWGNDGVNRFDETDHFRINRKQLSRSLEVEEVCTEIERAGREGYWLVYVLHEMRETPKEVYQISVEQLRGVLDCAARLRDAGTIRLMTARDALAEVPNTPR
jgi:peptidoglycan/xylan/chitin deacetylase (PgdA/CDA1 family)